MKVIVVTGSTRGIGLGLAREFLTRGAAVVVTGRGPDAVSRAVASLGPADRVFGQSADMTRAGDVQTLWDAAAKRFGRVDIWINNAGASHPPEMFWDLDAATTDGVVQANLLGMMNGARVALRGMLAQGSGFLYNMEGFGSGGQMSPGMSVYGATKRALTYFTATLVKELKGKPVKAGFLSPGIVLTDLLVDNYKAKPERFEQAKKFFNMMAETVETVTPYLAERVLANEKHGARVAWPVIGKTLGRLVTFQKRDLFKNA
jgi:NAD(P)-dependent dehydrogenase (short-subunit alcohol dehydrogenase family)